MEVRQIETARLGVRRDARTSDETAVRSLMSSIQVLGIMSPLRVRPKRLYVNGVEDDGFEIIAGAHRYRAALKLGLEDVPCVVVNDDDLRAELTMIDENLSRADLSPADRAAQTARRKAIYLQIYPETAQHVAGAHASNAAQGNASANLAVAFTEQTATATGKSERAIQRDAERGEKISERALSLVAGTDLDKGTYLDKLKKIESEDEQVETVTRALAGLVRAQEREKAEASAKRSQSRIDADVQHRAMREVAEILAEYVPAEFWAGLKANLYAAKKAAGIADELTNITGQAVMDHGEAAYRAVRS